MHKNELDIGRRQLSPYIQHQKTREHSTEPDFLHSAISVPASSPCSPLFPLQLLPLTLFSPLLAKKKNLSNFWCYHTNYSTNNQNGVSGLREISGWGWVCWFCVRVGFFCSDLRGELRRRMETWKEKHLIFALIFTPDTELPEEISPNQVTTICSSALCRDQLLYQHRHEEGK